jgi:hypothetical protein
MEVDASVTPAAGAGMTVQELVAYLSGEDPNITAEALKRARQVFLSQRHVSTTESSSHPAGAEDSASKPLVVQYLVGSPEAGEIMRLWEGMALHSTSRLHVALIDILGVILSCAPIDMALNVAKRVIRTRHKTLSAALSSENIRLTRMALKLFTNIAQLTVSNSREVIRALNLQPKVVDHLLATRHNSPAEKSGEGKRGKEGTQHGRSGKPAKAIALTDAASLAKHIHMHGHPDDDVRSNFLRLICTLLQCNAPDVVRECVRIKGLVGKIVKGLKEDADRVVVDTLSAFGDAFLLHSFVPRKVYLETWTTPVLNDLLSLYERPEQPVRYALHSFVVPLATGRLVVEDPENIERFHAATLEIPQSDAAQKDADAPRRKRRRVEDARESSSGPTNPFLGDEEYSAIIAASKLPLTVPCLFSEARASRSGAGHHSSSHDTESSEVRLASIVLNSTFTSADDAAFQFSYVSQDDSVREDGEAGAGKAADVAEGSKVLQFLQQIKNPQEHLVRDLILRVLRTHPDCVPDYIQAFPYSLEPRPSTRWAANVTLAVYALQVQGRVVATSMHPRLVLIATGHDDGKAVHFTVDDTDTADTVGGVAADTLISNVFPRGLTRALLTRGVLSTNVVVCAHVLRLLRAVLGRFEQLLTTVCNVTLKTAGELLAGAGQSQLGRIRFSTAGKRAVTMAKVLSVLLPDVQSIIAVRAKISNLQTAAAALTDVTLEGETKPASDVTELTSTWKRELHELLLHALADMISLMPAVMLHAPGSAMQSNSFDFLRLVPSVPSVGASSYVDKEVHALADLLSNLPAPTSKDVPERWLSKARPIIGTAAETGTLSDCPLAALLLLFSQQPNAALCQALQTVIRRVLLSCDDPSAPQSVAMDDLVGDGETAGNSARLFRSILLPIAKQLAGPLQATEADSWLLALKSNSALREEGAESACVSFYGLVWCGAYDATPSPYAALQRLELSGETNLQAVVRGSLLAPFTYRAWLAFAAALMQEFESVAGDDAKVAAAVGSLARVAGVATAEDEVSLPTNTTRSVVAAQYATALYPTLLKPEFVQFLVEATRRVLALLPLADRVQVRQYCDRIATAAIQALRLSVSHRESGDRAGIQDMVIALETIASEGAAPLSQQPKGFTLLVGAQPEKATASASKRKREKEVSEEAVSAPASVTEFVSRLDKFIHLHGNASNAWLPLLAAAWAVGKDAAEYAAKKLFSGAVFHDSSSIFASAIVARACGVDVDDKLVAADFQAASTWFSASRAALPEVLSYEGPKLERSTRELVALVIDQIPAPSLLEQAMHSVHGVVPYSSARARRVINAAILRALFVGVEVEADGDALLLHPRGDVHVPSVLAHTMSCFLFLLNDSPLCEAALPDVLQLVATIVAALSGGKPSVSRKAALGIQIVSTPPATASFEEIASVLAGCVVEHPTATATFTAAISDAHADLMTAQLIAQLCVHASKLATRQHKIGQYVAAALRQPSLASAQFLTHVRTILSEAQRGTVAQTLLKAMKRSLSDADSLQALAGMMCTFLESARRTPNTELLDVSLAALSLLYTSGSPTACFPIASAVTQILVKVAETDAPSNLPAFLAAYAAQPSTELFTLVRQLQAKYHVALPDAESLIAEIASELRKPLQKKPSRCISAAAAVLSAEEETGKGQLHAILRLALFTSADMQAHSASLLPLILLSVLYLQTDAEHPFVTDVQQTSVDLLSGSAYTLNDDDLTFGLRTLKTWMESEVASASPNPAAAWLIAHFAWAARAHADSKGFLTAALLFVCKHMASLPSVLLNDETADVSGALIDALLKAGVVVISVHPREEWSEEEAETAEQVKTAILSVLRLFMAPATETKEERSTGVVHLLSLPGALTYTEHLLKFAYDSGLLKVKSKHSSRFPALEFHRQLIMHPSFPHLLLRDRNQFVHTPRSSHNIKCRWDFASGSLEEFGRGARHSIAKLLLVLTTADAACVSADLLPVIAAAYTASLSVTDRTLRRLMVLYEVHGFSPASIGYTWSASALAHIQWHKQLWMRSSPEAAETRKAGTSFEWLFAAESQHAVESKEAPRPATSKAGIKGRRQRPASTIVASFQGPDEAKLFVHELHSSQTGLLPHRIHASLAAYPIYRSAVNPGDPAASAQFSDTISAHATDNSRPFALQRSVLNEHMAQIAYDPSYVLPCLLTLMSSARVNPRRFVSSGALSLALMALTSARVSARKIGYAIVGAYFELLQTPNVRATFKEQGQVSLVLSALRNAVSESFERLPSIHVSFVIACLYVVMRPMHRLYTIVNKYFLKTTTLDTSDIPMLYSSFRSGDTISSVQQLWMLRVLARAMQCGNDHAVLRRRHGYHLLMTLFNSPAVPVEIVRGIAASLLSASRLRILTAKLKVDPSREEDSDSDSSDADDSDEEGGADGAATKAGEEASDDDSDVSEDDDEEKAAHLPEAAKKAVEAVAPSLLADISETDGPTWEDYRVKVAVSALRRRGKPVDASSVSVDCYNVSMGVSNYLRKACGAIAWVTAIWNSISDASLRTLAAASAEDRRGDRNVVTDLVVIRGAHMSAIPIDALFQVSELLFNMFEACNLLTRASVVGSSAANRDVASAIRCEVAEFSRAFTIIKDRAESLLAILSQASFATHPTARKLASLAESLAVQPARAALLELAAVEAKLIK